MRASPHRNGWEESNGCVQVSVGVLNTRVRVSVRDGYVQLSNGGGPRAATLIHVQYLSESMCMCAWSDRMELSAREREMDWDGELRCARERDGCRMHVRVVLVV